MIKNIVFDMGGVLISFDAQRYTARFVPDPADYELIRRELFRSVEWIRMDRGSITDEQAVSSVCRRLPEHLRGPARELTLNWWRRWLLPVEGMADLVRELKGLGYGVYLLSNAKLDLPLYFDRIPGSECFDGKIVSADWKLLKPQPEIYETLLREYGLRAEECFFIDDLNINIEGAWLVGMDGAIFDEDLPRLRRALNDAGVPVKA